jgi:hypothetical protein
MLESIGELLPEINEGRCILFLGSGSTVACESPWGGGTTGKELAEAIVKKLEGTFSASLEEASEFLETKPPRHRSGLDEFIRERLRDLRPTTGHLLLTMFPWRAIVTTNFNQAIEKGYEVARERGLTTRELLPVLTDQDLAKLSHVVDGRTPLFKPHGCISALGRSDTPLVLTPRDYYLSITKRRAMYDYIKQLAERFCTLFVGYSLTDYNFNNIYYELRGTLQDYVMQSYTVFPVDKQKADHINRVYAQRNITLIDDTFDTFMLTLASEAGLLTGTASDVAADELARPSVLAKLRSYASTLPESVRETLRSRGITMP